MSKLFPEITKHRRELVKVIEDGSAKTFVYKDVDEKEDKGGFFSRFFNKQSDQPQRQAES